MMKLLKIEWNKLFYYRATRTFILIYFLMLIIGGLILAYFKPEINNVQLNLGKMGFFDFPVVWLHVSYLMAFLKIFIGVLIIMNITNEYSNNTLKQNLIDGMSKKEFLTSKVLTNTMLALFSTLFLIGITIVLGLYFSESKGNFLSGIEYAGTYFIKLSLFFSICMFLSVWLRKTAFAFLGLIVLWMIEAAVSTAEFLLRAWMKNDFKNISESDFYFSNYLPLNVSGNLIKYPKVNFDALITGGEIFSFRPMEWNCILAALVYTVLFILLSYRLLRKRDL